VKSTYYETFLRGKPAGEWSWQVSTILVMSVKNKRRFTCISSSHLCVFNFTGLTFYAYDPLRQKRVVSAILPCRFTLIYSLSVWFPRPAAVNFAMNLLAFFLRQVRNLLTLHEGQHLECRETAITLLPLPTVRSWNTEHFFYRYLPLKANSFNSWWLFSWSKNSLLQEADGSSPWSLKSATFLFFFSPTP
jgi:hypothetical protein